VKVRFKRGWWRTYASLTPGNVYRVLGINDDELRIVNDLGEPILFSRLAFDVVDASTPSDWISERDEDNVLHSQPSELAAPFFYERWHDRDSEACAVLARYLWRLCSRDAEALEESANTHLRVAWKHASADKPVVLYSELDEQRFEVRKIEIVADGHAGWADGRDSTAETQLGTERVPSIEQIAADPEFDPAPISRAEFDRLRQQTALAESEE
jgi:hypothetical protein